MKLTMRMVAGQPCSVSAKRRVSWPDIFDPTQHFHIKKLLIILLLLFTFTVYCFMIQTRKMCWRKTAIRSAGIMAC